MVYLELQRFCIKVEICHIDCEMQPNGRANSHSFFFVFFVQKNGVSLSFLGNTTKTNKKTDIF